MCKNIWNVDCNSTISRTQVQLLYNRFKAGLKDVNDGARPSRPSTSTTDEIIEAVQTMILNTSRITIREVADDVGISFGSLQAIFTDVLGTKRAAAMIAKFWAKTTSHGYRTRDFDGVQRRSRSAHKGYYWWRIMGVWLGLWNQSPIVPIENVLLQLRR